MQVDLSPGLLGIAVVVLCTGIGWLRSMDQRKVQKLEREIDDARKEQGRIQRRLEKCDQEREQLAARVFELERQRAQLMSEWHDLRQQLDRMMPHRPSPPGLPPAV